MVLLTEAEATQAIKNFKRDLRVNSRMYGKSGKREFTGAAADAVSIVDEAIATHGVRFVGSVLEDARRDLSFDEPWFYYETNNTEILDKQDFEITNFSNEILKLVKRLEDEIARQQERSETEQERREMQQNEKTEKRRKKSKAEIKEEYTHVRRQLQQLVRRRKAAGKPFVSVPKIPKKITEGSIRNLQRRIAKIKLM